MFQTLFVPRPAVAAHNIAARDNQCTGDTDLARASSMHFMTCSSQMLDARDDKSHHTQTTNLMQQAPSPNTLKRPPHPELRTSNDQSNAAGTLR